MREKICNQGIRKTQRTRAILSDGYGARESEREGGGERRTRRRRKDLWTGR